MKLIFPPGFFFGTSTSAGQIETAFQHDWQGVRAKDGYTFDKTTDHENKVDEDVEIISSLAPNYRMSLMWSKLQRQPYGAFDSQAVQGYHVLLDGLKSKNVAIMMVLYHWTNPTWFAAMGGWENDDSAGIFEDFATKLIKEFGHYVTYWNTFNEPNLYSTFGYALGQFPPYRKNLLRASRVIRNMGTAHRRIYSLLKNVNLDCMVGVSHNCVSFHHDNIAGVIPSSLAQFWYMKYLPKHFFPCDYIGISYYARLSFDPFPVTYLGTPDKLLKGNRHHDNIWEYYPEGLDTIVRKCWEEHRLPIIITENGVCTDDDAFRISSLRDYMKIIHRLIGDQIDVLGYYHWSTWDNFEWTLGPTYKFGLYDCNPDTMERRKKPSADVFSRLAYHHEIAI